MRRLETVERLIRNPWVRRIGATTLGLGTVFTPVAGVAQEIRPSSFRQTEPVQLVSHNYGATTTNNAIYDAADSGCAYDIVFAVTVNNQITNGWLNASSPRCWQLVANTPLGNSTGGYSDGRAEQAGRNELQFNLQPGQIRVSTQIVHGNWDNLSWLDSSVIYNPFNNSIPQALSNPYAYNIGNLSYQGGRITNPNLRYGNGITCVGGALNLGGLSIFGLTCN